MTVDEQASDVPIEIVHTDNRNLKEQVEKIAARNLEEEFKEINGIPNPEKNASNASNATKGFLAGCSTQSRRQHSSLTIRPMTFIPVPGQGFGELGRNFEFMMLKLAQLETLCELQQVEIESLKKTVKGLAEHVDHQDSVVSLVQKDEGTRMQEAQHTLKRVLSKHVHQRATKEFHPKPRTAGRPTPKPHVQRDAKGRSGRTGPFKEAGETAESWGADRDEARAGFRSMSCGVFAVSACAA